jgi:hypothetical protein
LKVRKDSVTVLLTAALIATQDFQLRFRSGRVPACLLQREKVSLLLCELAFAFDDLTFDLSQLV